MEQITAARNDCVQTCSTAQADHLKQRLPCRGCTSNCSNHQYCDGKPWRMNKDRG